MVEDENLRFAVQTGEKRFADVFPERGRIVFIGQEVNQKAAV